MDPLPPHPPPGPTPPYAPPMHSYLPPPPPPPRGRSASFWVAILLALLLGGSVLLNLALAVGAGVATGRGAEGTSFNETLLAGSVSSSDKVLDIAVNGVIMEGKEDGPFSEMDPVRLVREVLRQARKDDHVKAVLLEINSPGGGINASDVIYHELAAYRKERNVPIVVVCKDLTASGGYYISQAADHIMAHQTSMVGSIGVIAEFLNVEGLMSKVGMRMNVIKSERANGTESFKDIGSPFRAMKPAERKFLQSMIRQMWNRFVDVVAIGRKGRLTREQIADLADGRIWTGQQALELKLVDSLGYRNDAWKKAAELGKAPNARLVQYGRREGLLRAILGAQGQSRHLESLLGASLDPYSAATPRIMYLWTGR